MSKDIIPDENQKKKINQTNTSNMKDNSKSKEDIDILENDKTMNSENKKGPPKACLFVASFHPNTTEKALFDFFSPFGNLLKVKLQKDKLGRPYAFVQYQNEKDAENALEKVQNKTLDGRIIRVEKAKVHRTLFLAKLDKSMTSSQIRQIVEVYGPVESVSLIRNYQTNKSKGCAFVKFVFREDAIKAFTSLKNLQKKWAVEWATSPNDPEALGIDKCNIFVGGLNSSLITKELLEQKFSSYGTIENISLIKRSNNNQMSVPKNSFAFIRYKDPESSIPAIENENGSEWLGEKIRVQYCQTQEMKEKKKIKILSSQCLNESYFNQMGGITFYDIPSGFYPQEVESYGLYPSPLINPMIAYPPLNSQSISPNWQSQQPIFQTPFLQFGMIPTTTTFQPSQTILSPQPFFYPENFPPEEEIHQISQQFQNINFKENENENLQENKNDTIQKEHEHNTIHE